MPNRKNGSSQKTVKSSVGAFELDTPRARQGAFESKFIKKIQNSLLMRATVRARYVLTWYGLS